MKTAEEKYPQEIKLEAVKADCDRLDEFEIGDEITVGFNLRGNEYNGKHYVSLQAWKFSGAGEQQSRPARERQKLPPAPPAADYDGDDDIPF